MPVLDFLISAEAKKPLSFTIPVLLIRVVYFASLTVFLLDVGPVALIAF